MVIQRPTAIHDERIFRLGRGNPWRHRIGYCSVAFGRFEEAVRAAPGSLVVGLARRYNANQRRSFVPALVGVFSLGRCDPLYAPMTMSNREMALCQASERSVDGTCGAFCGAFPVKDILAFCVTRVYFFCRERTSAILGHSTDTANECNHVNVLEGRLPEASIALTEVLAFGLLFERSTCRWTPFPDNLL